MVIDDLHLSWMFEFKVALFIPILIYFVIHLTSSVFKKSIYSNWKKNLQAAQWTAFALSFVCQRIVSEPIRCSKYRVICSCPHRQETCNRDWPKISYWSGNAGVQFITYLDYLQNPSHFELSQPNIEHFVDSHLKIVFIFKTLNNYYLALHKPME